MKTIPNLIRNALAGAAAFLFLNPTIQAAAPSAGPDLPLLKVAAVSVFHQAYLPDSVGLKAALKSAKGDRGQAKSRSW